MDKSIIGRGAVLLGTTNPGKIAELRAVLGAEGVAVVAPPELGLDLRVAETGTTFSENATLKATAYAEISGLTAVADDSGLIVDALGGRPGLFSARFAGPDATDADRIRRLLGELDAIAPDQRRARFVAVIALAVPGQDVLRFEGRVEGQIAREPRGDRGFGYDPVFEYRPARATFGELEPEQKALVSHRGRALARLAGFARGTRQPRRAPYTWPG